MGGKWYGDINAGEVILPMRSIATGTGAIIQLLKTATTNDDDHIKVIKQPYRWMQWRLPSFSYRASLGFTLMIPEKAARKSKRSGQCVG